MRRHHLMRSFPLAACVAVVAGCASKPPETDASPTVMRPLERMAGQQIGGFPVQYLAFTDTLGWQQQIPNRAAYLAALDDQIEAAMTARGIKSWDFRREVGRCAKMNSILMTNPR